MEVGQVEALDVIALTERTGKVSRSVRHSTQGSDDGSGDAGQVRPAPCRSLVRPGRAVPARKRQSRFPGAGS